MADPQTEAGDPGLNGPTLGPWQAVSEKYKVFLKHEFPHHPPIPEFVQGAVHRKIVRGTAQEQTVWS